MRETWGVGKLSVLVRSPLIILPKGNCTFTDCTMCRILCLSHNNVGYSLCDIETKCLKHCFHFKLPHLRLFVYLFCLSIRKCYTQQTYFTYRIIKKRKTCPCKQCSKKIMKWTNYEKEMFNHLIFFIFQSYSPLSRSRSNNFVRPDSQDHNQSDQIITETLWHLLLWSLYWFNDINICLWYICKYICSLDFTTQHLTASLMYILHTMFNLSKPNGGAQNLTILKLLAWNKITKAAQHDRVLNLLVLKDWFRWNDRSRTHTDQLLAKFTIPCLR